MEDENPNYFEFFNLPVSFIIDEQMLKTKFYAYSKQYHPDFYINQSPQEQAHVLTLSAMNNRAYKILSNPDLRLAYTLRLLNVLDEHENYQLSQEFLMEMMDINEQVMDAEKASNAENQLQLVHQIKEFVDELNIEQNRCFGAFELDLPSDKKLPILLSIKDLYFKKKYLLRIQEKLHRFASL